MLPIHSKVATFYINNDRLQVWGDDILYNHKNYWESQYATVSDIRQSSGYPVNTFKNLVELTGQIAIRNRQFDMFFRGQKKIIKIGTAGALFIPPFAGRTKKKMAHTKAPLISAP